MDALHRISFEFFPLVNPDYFPSSTYVLNPDMSPVSGVPKKYWKLTGDVLSVMSQAEKDAVDAAQLSTQRDNMAAVIENPNSVWRAFAEVVLDEINILRAQHALAPRTLAQLRTAMRNKLNG